MTMQHTSGPWWIGHGTLSIYSAEGRIADLKQSANDDQDMADAYLIAAAPDLLSACIAIANGYKHKGEELARAAIAKATGEQA